jgi:hypothetical protein
VLNVDLRSGTAQFLSGSREAVATLCLEDLRSKHRELLLAIDEMLSLLVGDGFDAESYYAARIRLMQASFERHWLWRRIFDYLIGRVGLIDAETLKRLQSRDMDLLATFSQHSRCWPPARIEADWHVYEPQMRAICSGMLSSIDDEQDQLYPLLERLCGALMPRI